MKYNNAFIYLVLLFILILFKSAHSYEISITEKYNDIFSTKLLNDDDLENYRKIYNLQKKCKWKSANKYIFAINNKISMNMK